MTPKPLGSNDQQRIRGIHPTSCVPESHQREYLVICRFTGKSRLKAIDR